MTQKCQPGASVTGQSAAGEGATVNTAKKWAGSNGSGRRAEAAVMSSAKLMSRPAVQGQHGNPVSWSEDGAPVFRSSNGSHAHNGCPVNRSSCRINSAVGQAAPLAGEEGDASPPP
jgi:hypothetical protein